MKELLETYKKHLQDSNISPALSDYLTTLAAQSLKAIETLNSFTPVQINVTIE